jgi:hypothetical protein
LANFEWPYVFEFVNGSGFAFEFVGAGFTPPGAWQHSAGRLFLNLPTFLNLLLNL